MCIRFTPIFWWFTRHRQVETWTISYSRRRNAAALIILCPQLCAIKRFEQNAVTCPQLLRFRKYLFLDVAFVRASSRTSTKRSVPSFHTQKIKDFLFRAMSKKYSHGSVFFLTTCHACGTFRSLDCSSPPAPLVASTQKKTASFPCGCAEPPPPSPRRLRRRQGLCEPSTFSLSPSTCDLSPPHHPFTTFIVLTVPSY